MSKCDRLANETIQFWGVACQLRPWKYLSRDRSTQVGLMMTQDPRVPDLPYLLTTDVYGWNMFARWMVTL